MKRRIIALFKQADGQFVSGEALSEALACSRTAIWKHISELREKGFEFEAIRRSGYRLQTVPDIPYAEVITSELKTNAFGQEVHFFPTVESTQTPLHKLAREGVPEGTIVVAEQQLGGKGRLGRSWHSPAGTGIWFSLLLRPKLELQQCPQLTLVAAVAIAETVAEQTALPIQIKWPNDLLLDNKKVCGILTELRAESDCVEYIVLGIGLNVNTLSFPPELEEVATSLAIAKKETIHRVSLLQGILEKLEELYQLYLSDGFGAIKPRWEAFAQLQGKKVTVRRVNSEISGIALGIDDQGVLLIQTENGETERIYSADIEIG